ncbi:DMT family transporter [uncultured Tateyamaria sp.]|uniref:DMT family transporter n=1 Tax=uncultured Tateyamaria sp. TaxID=455651 RepID=UPI002627F380|nr:DMT family transporter [uncultured Tateyamaria sp.]
MAITARAQQDRAALGIAMTLGAYAFFALIDTSVKWLVLAGLPAFQLAFMRYLPHFIISTLLVLRQGASWSNFQTDHLGLVMLRAFLLASATLFNFITLKYLSLTVTGSIMFSAPIIVCALSWPLLGERVGPWRWGAIMLGFVGVLVVIRPFDAAFHWIALLNVYNAISLALYSIITRKISGVVAAETMQFYMGAFGAILLAPFALNVWVMPDTPFQWAVMIGLGIWGWAGHEIFSRAHSYAPANTLMPYTYSFLLYLAIASYVVFSEVPDGWTILGATIIVCSGFIVWWRTSRKEIT